MYIYRIERIAVIVDDLICSRYECTEGRSKRSILKLIKLLIGKAKKKEKKCDAVPVRNCARVSKVKPVVKCKQH